MIKPWKTLSKNTVLEFNNFLKVESHQVQIGNGTIIQDWPWIITPDFVNIITLTSKGEFICFHQTKYAVEGTSLAPVGGYIGQGEDPLEAARRELLEETGYSAPDWTFLGKYAVDGNRGSGQAWLYLAQNAQKISEPNADDLEDQEILFLSREQINQALKKGEFKVLPWVTALSLALLRLDEK